MKTFLRAFSIGMILLAAQGTTWAQGMNVALLDVGYIFKNHPGFQQQMESMKAQVAQIEQSLKQQQTQIQTSAQQMSAYKPGSPKYKQIEEQTAKQLADLKVKTQLQRKEIMENEAKIYLATYKRVHAAIQAYAKKNRIDLVLRYDREAASGDSADPRGTLKIINRPIVYHDALDISDAILVQFGGGLANGRANPRK